MKKKRQPPIEHRNIFYCCLKEFSVFEFKEHIAVEHGFQQGTVCKRTLSMAVDGSDFFSNSFDWEIPCGAETLKIRQVMSGPLGKHDLLSGM